MTKRADMVGPTHYDRETGVTIPTPHVNLSGWKRSRSRTVGDHAVPLDPLGFLTAWYAGQCDGDWEHEYGIRIETLDNPGWSVELDLEETELDGVTLDRIEVAEGDSWIQAWSDGAAFHLRCGPADLGPALEPFRDFATLNGGKDGYRRSIIRRPPKNGRPVAVPLTTSA